METFTLSREERELLDRIVTNYLSELRMEIADTDQLSFKENLRKEEDILNDLIKKIKIEI